MNPGTPVHAYQPAFSCFFSFPFLFCFHPETKYQATLGLHRCLPPDSLLASTRHARLHHASPHLPHCGKSGPASLQVAHTILLRINLEPDSIAASEGRLRPNFFSRSTALVVGKTRLAVVVSANAGVGAEEERCKANRCRWAAFAGAVAFPFPLSALKG
jgi:hypothetical protein